METVGWSRLDAMWRWGCYAAEASWAQASGRRAIERLRGERLAGLLRWTARHSAFYRERWKDVANRELPLEDLPPVHKAELMARFDDWVTDPEVTLAGAERFCADPARIGEPFLGRYALFSSSGTTGVPGLLVHDADALAIYDALSATRMGALAPALGDAGPLSGQRFALIAATEGHFAGVVTWERLRALNPWFEANALVLPVTAPLDAIVDALAHFRPTVVASYATVLRALAHEHDAGRLPIHPSVMWYGGEWLAPAARAHIERSFACRVAGDYGASEFMNIAFECEQGSLHVNDDWVILEPVDANYGPVGPDTPSASVLLTNLANHVQPLVRYELGDSVTLVSKPCACGRPFPVIRIDGRRDEILRLHDAWGREVPVLPMALCTAIEEATGVHRFQVVQTGPQALRVRVERGGGSREAGARVKRALLAFLEGQGVEGVSLRVEAGAIAANPVSGKFRQVCRGKAPPGREDAATASRSRARGSRRPRSAP